MTKLPKRAGRPRGFDYDKALNRAIGSNAQSPTQKTRFNRTELFARTDNFLFADHPSTKRRAVSPQGQREPEVLVLTCFEPRQQSQRIVTADAIEIVCRKTEPHNAFSRFGEGHERIIAVKQDLCVGTKLLSAAIAGP